VGPVETEREREQGHKAASSEEEKRSTNERIEGGREERVC